MIDIASGIESFSTNDVGSDKFAAVPDSGGSLTLANAGAVYTIDELEANDTEIDDDDESSYDNTFGDYGSSGRSAPTRLRAGGARPSARLARRAPIRSRVIPTGSNTPAAAAATGSTTTLTTAIPASQRKWQH